jgi:hypothetical protein
MLAIFATVDLVVYKTPVRVQVHEAKETRVGAGTKRHNLLLVGRIGEEKLGD